MTNKLLIPISMFLFFTGGISLASLTGQPLWLLGVPIAVAISVAAI